MTQDVKKDIDRLLAILGPLVYVILLWRKITKSDKKQSALLNDLMLAIKNLSEYTKNATTHAKPDIDEWIDHVDDMIK